MLERWWRSIDAMRRIARVSMLFAGVGLGTGILAGTTDMLVAAASLFVGAAGVACTMFARFRVQHLRELDELRRLTK